MRDGRWKLIEFYESGEVELYDLLSDIGELRDLSEKHPDRVKTMRHHLLNWQQQMRAKMPKPNPGWQPSTN